MSETKSIATLTLAEHIKACEQSKLSIADYARQQGVSAQRLYQARHFQKLKAKPNRKVKSAHTDNKRYPAPEFLPVSLPPALHACSITTPNGFHVSVKQALSVEDMALLIKALQS